ncbi:MAG: hypothetical protein ABL914_10610 [Novosphingobium sp.]|uniref:hypothetical protein n=1 Tax=Novosphingobium sp. TaxID=1874826 RepID=UPI0032BAEDDE
MPQEPGSYALISVIVVPVNGTNELQVDFTALAFMKDDTTPVVSVYPASAYPAAADIVLPTNSNRPFAFVVRFESSGLGGGYNWHSNPLMCVAIGPIGTEPGFGNPLPNGFSGPINNGGGEICFINANNTKDKKQYEYRIALYPLAGGNPLILDPKITNGGSN